MMQDGEEKFWSTVGSGNNYTVSDNTVRTIKKILNKEGSPSVVFIVRFLDHENHAPTVMPFIKSFGSFERAAFVAKATLIDALNSVIYLPKKSEKDYNKLVSSINNNEGILSLIDQFNLLFQKAKIKIRMDIIELRVM